MTTAPVRAREERALTTVPVALGERAYDIIVGRGLVESAAARIAALGAKAAAIVINPGLWKPSVLSTSTADEIKARHESSAAR